MKIHTEQFKNAITRPGRQFDYEISVRGGKTYKGGDLTSVLPTSNTELLKSVMKSLEFNCVEPINVGDTLDLQIGVKVGNKYEYLDYGNYIVYNVEYQADTKDYKHTCYDNMLRTMVTYNGLDDSLFPMTLKDYFFEVNAIVGLFVPPEIQFINQDKILDSDPYKGLNYTIRDINDEIAQVIASNIFVDSEENIFIKPIKQIQSDDELDIIDEDILKNVNVEFGEHYGEINSLVLSRSADSDTIYRKDETSIAQNGLCEFKIKDNQILNNNNRDEYIDNIFYAIKGTKFYLNDFSTLGVMYLDLLDYYFVKIGDKKYKCLMLNDEQKFQSGLEENIYTEKPTQTTTDYTKSDTTDKRERELWLIVDKQGKKIESLATDFGEMSTNIEKESNSGIIEVENIVASQPLYINVKPQGTSISYQYPRNNLYPSNTTYLTNRVIRFTNKTTNKYYDYELPDDLLYIDKDNFDEFTLDYQNRQCIVNKKVEYKANGTLQIKSKPIIEEFEYPTIDLTDGEYEISVLGYNNAYIKIKVVINTQFATRSSLTQTADQIMTNVSKEYATTKETSQISQRADEISIEVSKKVGDDEVISKINTSAESVKIDTNKLDIDGIATFTNNKLAEAGSTTINGANITTGTLSANRISGGTISASTIKLKGVNIGTNSTTIGSLSIVDGELSNNRMTIDTKKGEFSLSHYLGGSMILSNAARLSATRGIGISSNSDGLRPAPSNNNIDLKACSDAGVYLGSMKNANGTTETASILVENTRITMKATGNCTLNGLQIATSSSRATKENIENLTDNQKEEVYELLKNIQTKQYDYKPQYGKKFNYGFIIEDIEDTKLKDLLHITQSDTNKDIKLYSTEDLARLELITIQELMKKIDKLEDRIKELEAK